PGNGSRKNASKKIVPSAAKAVTSRLQPSGRTGSAAFYSALFRRYLRPGIGFHVAKFGLLPRQFRMLSKMLLGEKIGPAGVIGRRGKSHLPRHGGIGSLILHGAGRAVRRLPSTHTTRRHLDVATERAFAWFVFAGNRIHMIGEKFLCGRDVNL